MPFACIIRTWAEDKLLLQSHAPVSTRPFAGLAFSLLLELNLRHFRSKRISYVAEHSCCFCCFHRLHKCKLCYKQLKNISNIVKNKSGLSGRHGSAFRELHLLMAVLEWQLSPPHLQARGQNPLCSWSDWISPLCVFILPPQRSRDQESCWLATCPAPVPNGLGLRPEWRGACVVQGDQAGWGFFKKSL